MKILALEPYYGGSHKAFLDGWAARSRHEWTLIGLPPYKWKWRVRHAPITLAEDVRERVARGESWDIILCSSMLSLADFIGLAPEPIRRLPSVVYFHENQLTYPVQAEKERDFHFGLANITTALAASRVWFNSAFNRDEFLGAMDTLWKRMPDYQPTFAAARICDKSDVRAPGIDDIAPRDEPRAPGPLRLLWAARWEHDKDPESFFRAMELLERAGVPFRLNVIGEEYERQPEIFARVREQFAARIDRWGWQPTREDYIAALRESDVFISTARHEFFGLSAAEAIAAGCYPLLPSRLAYPELLQPLDESAAAEFFYDGSPRALASRLELLHARLAHDGSLWQGRPHAARAAVTRFFWSALVPEYDAALDLIL